jgi:hypothetical protein
VFTKWCIESRNCRSKPRWRERRVVNETLVRRCGVAHKARLIGRMTSKVLRHPLGKLFEAQDRSLMIFSKDEGQSWRTECRNTRHCHDLSEGELLLRRESHIALLSFGEPTLTRCSYRNDGARLRFLAANFVAAKSRRSTTPPQSGCLP